MKPEGIDRAEAMYKNAVLFGIKKFVYDGFLVSKLDSGDWLVWSYANKNTEYLVIPEFINVIMEGAFSDMTNLKEVVLPLRLKEINFKAFYNCFVLEKVNFPDSLLKIGNYAFYKTALQEIYIPDKVTYIGKHCFYGVQKAKLVSLPSHLTVDEEAFYLCGSEQRARGRDNFIFELREDVNGFSSIDMAPITHNSDIFRENLSAFYPSAARKVYHITLYMPTSKYYNERKGRKKVM